jgi:hypothetical protein
VRRYERKPAASFPHAVVAKNHNGTKGKHENKNFVSAKEIQRKNLIKKDVLGRTNRLRSLIRHGPH